MTDKRQTSKKDEDIQPDHPDAIIEPGSGSSKEDIVLLLTAILRLAMDMMNADHGGIILDNPINSVQSDDPVKVDNLVATYTAPESEESSFSPSQSVIHDVISTGDPVLVHDTETDPRYEGSKSIILYQITSIMCVPMVFEEKVIGAIYLDSRRNRQHFTQDNIRFLRIFGKMAAIAVNYAQDYRILYREKQRLQDEVQRSWNLTEIIGKEIIGRSPKMWDVFNLMRRVMNSDISVLLEGDSGTGKELVARALHYNSPRRHKPFVAQFCGNLSEALLESELFGHKKGSFTGAIVEKKGLFEIADGGTFFLDEIADISPTIQAKLLRAIQEGEIRRVGDTKSLQVDVRIISATNKSLQEEVNAGRFREDLYYRLNVITIKLPALCERIGDIPLLVKHFLQRFSAKNKLLIKKISPRAMRVLENYSWPGNIRELENTIERATTLAEGDVIDIDDLFIPQAESLASGRKSLKDHEREIVLKTLEEFGNNKTKTAEALGVSLRWLHYKMNEWKKIDG
ncbi:MAG: sigma 54-interacting transcriptional regulator [Candidatus Electryoneaceae bacterium]|nr:sigma 54-interacting transcriptional regulator [Candidatus Electryoneaceae bacterium]